MEKEGSKDEKNFVGRCKYHIMSSLHGKATPFAMCKALTDLFQRNSDQRKLALKDKLRKIKMEKGDNIPKFSRSLSIVGMKWEVWGLLLMMKTCELGSPWASKELA